MEKGFECLEHCQQRSVFRTTATPSMNFQAGKLSTLPLQRAAFVPIWSIIAEVSRVGADDNKMN